MEGTSLEETGLVVIERKSDRDIKYRDLYIKIDDRTEQNILFDDALEIRLPIGAHRIKASNRLYSKSAELKLGPGETIRFQVANVPTKGIFAFMMILGGTPPYRVTLDVA